MSIDKVGIDKIGRTMILQKNNGTASTGAQFPAPVSGRGIALCAIVIGAAIRLYLYLQHTSLWFDEIALSLNIAGRSYLNLFHPLWIQQSAPLLYLWIERTFVIVFGVNEWSLRALSLACGMGVLFLVQRLSARLFTWRTTVLAVLLASFSSFLVHYSNEVKPYSEDAFITLALTILAVDCLNKATRWRKAALLTAGCILPWLSTPAIFVLGGIGTSLLIQSMERKEAWASRKWIVGFLLASAVSFALAYKYIYSAAAANSYMKSFWAGLVINRSWPVQRIALTCFNAIADPIFGIFGKPPKLLFLAALPLFATGVRGLWLRGRLPLVALFLTSLICAWAAAYLGLWVLSTRLMLFFSPLAIILLALGVTELANFAPSPMWRTATLLGLVMATLLLPFKYTLWSLRFPEIQPNRQLVTTTLRATQPGDTVYIYSRAAAAWLFYSTSWSTATQADVEKGVQDVERIGPNSGNCPPRGRPVSGEGLSWWQRREHHTELFGIPTGIQNIDSGSRGSLDQGFAENETARIRATGSRRIWLVASEYHPEPIESLVLRLHEEGFSCRNFFLGSTTLGFQFQRADSAQGPNPPCPMP